MADQRLEARRAQRVTWLKPHSAVWPTYTTVEGAFGWPQFCNGGPLGFAAVHHNVTAARTSSDTRRTVCRRLLRL